MALMRKRVCDVAGTIGKNTKVYLNGERLPIKGFSDYVNLYLGGKDASARCYEQVNPRWEVCVAVSEGQFQQVSFVNSINTVKGGTHANYVADAVAAQLLERINKKNKNAGVKPFQVKSHLWVFVNAQIENPAFDSQTKETLTTKASSFGSKCEISEEFIKKVLKTGVVESVLAFAAFKQSKELKKTDGAKRSRLTGIPKLDDANEAGGRNSEKCTLILTEGDSAKALAISGLSVVGRDYFGVFPVRGVHGASGADGRWAAKACLRSQQRPFLTLVPPFHPVSQLRGKLLNVRDATHQQVRHMQLYPCAGASATDISPLLHAPPSLPDHGQRGDQRHQADPGASAREAVHGCEVAALWAADDHDGPGPRRVPYQGPAHQLPARPLPQPAQGACAAQQLCMCVCVCV